MSRNMAAGVVSTLFVVSVIACMYSILVVPTVEGFSSEDLHEPQPYTVQTLPDLPPVAGDWVTRPDITVTISVGNLYAQYGGAVSMTVHNNGSRRLYLVDMGFDWVGTQVQTEKEVHREIGPGEAYTIKTIATDGPAHEGEHNYRIRMRFLLFRNGQWFRVISGGEEWLQFSEHTVTVSPLGAERSNEVVLNQQLYYEKANDLMDFGSLAVEMAADIATATQGSNYNIAKVCAIFDYVNENIAYTDDPGEDLWYSPQDTLGYGRGDCEDYALLIAAMVEDAGGTTRMYLTNDHAFAAVYVGDSIQDFQNASAGVRSYYGTDAKVHALVDDSGYWLVTDPLGTFYAGGLAVGQSPTTGSDLEWNDTFEDTGTLYAVDITGEDINTPPWLNSKLWLVLITLFGLTDIVLIISITSKAGERCQVCNVEVGINPYRCAACGSILHQACARELGACPRCGAPVTLPPLHQPPTPP
jgi:hypothetical protein